MRIFPKGIFKGGSILRKWLLTYFLVLLIPLAVSGYGYFTSYRIIENEIENSNLLSLDLVSNMLDEKIDTAKHMCDQILMDQRLKDFLNSRIQGTERITLQTELVELLASYCQTTSALDVMIYIPELDYCISPRTAGSLERLYSGLTYSVKPEISEDQWRQELSEMDILPVISSAHLSYSNFNKSAVVYRSCSSSSITSTFLSQNSYTANIFISIGLDEIENILDSHTMSSLLILNRDGGLIESFGTEIPDFQLPDSGDLRQQLVQVGSEEYVCSSFSSSSSGLVYVTLTPSHLYWSPRYYFVTMSVILFSLACIVGVGLSLYLLYKNYSPLKRLLQHMDVQPEQKSNEFELIEQSFQKLNQESIQIKDRNLRQHVHLEEAYLRTVLMGTNWETLDNEVGSALEEKLEGKTLSLIALYTILPEKSPWRHERKEHRISLPFLLDNVLDELLEHRFPHVNTSFQDTVIFVFALDPEETASFEEYIIPALTELQSIFLRHYSWDIEAVLGDYTMDFNQLYTIYQQVKLLHAQNSLSEHKSILRASANGRQDTEALSMDVYLEPLCEAVSYLSWRDASQISDALFETLYSSSKPYTDIQFYMMSLVNRLRHIHQTGDNPALLKLMQEMTECQSLEKLHTIFSDILRLLCDSQPDKEPAASEDLHLRVKRYVNENYSDMNLNLIQISENIGLSPKYISRLFKIETGKRLPDYIMEIRIQKAKELMAQGELTLNAIAERVGYSSVKTFRRAFQKLENMNPSDYRGTDGTEEEPEE